jgi:hypothetical protein
MSKGKRKLSILDLISYYESGPVLKERTPDVIRTPSHPEELVYNQEYNKDNVDDEPGKKLTRRKKAKEIHKKALGLTDVPGGSPPGAQGYRPRSNYEQQDFETSFTTGFGGPSVIDAEEDKPPSNISRMDKSKPINIPFKTELKDFFSFLETGKLIRERIPKAGAVMNTEQKELNKLAIALGKSGHNSQSKEVSGFVNIALDASGSSADSGSTAGGTDWTPGSAIGAHKYQIGSGSNDSETQYAAVHRIASELRDNTNRTSKYLYDESFFGADKYMYFRLEDNTVTSDVSNAVGGGEIRDLIQDQYDLLIGADSVYSENEPRGDIYYKHSGESTPDGTTTYTLNLIRRGEKGYWMTEGHDGTDGFQAGKNTTWEDSPYRASFRESDWTTDPPTGWDCESVIGQGFGRWNCVYSEPITPESERSRAGRRSSRADRRGHSSSGADRRGSNGSSGEWYWTGGPSGSTSESTRAVQVELNKEEHKNKRDGSSLVEDGKWGGLTQSAWQASTGDSKKPWDIERTDTLTKESALLALSKPARDTTGAAHGPGQTVEVSDETLIKYLTYDNSIGGVTTPSRDNRFGKLAGWKGLGDGVYQRPTSPSDAVITIPLSDEFAKVILIMPGWKDSIVSDYKADLIRNAGLAEAIAGGTDEPTPPAPTSQKVDISDGGSSILPVIPPDDPRIKNKAVESPEGWGGKIAILAPGSDYMHEEFSYFQMPKSGQREAYIKETGQVIDGWYAPIFWRDNSSIDGPNWLTTKELKHIRDETGDKDAVKVGKGVRKKTQEKGFLEGPRRAARAKRKKERGSRRDAE